MGYTHYWYGAKWTTAEFRDGVAKILAASGVTLVHDDDKPRSKPEIGKRIWFNGVGDDGHETFVFDAEGAPSPDGFACCKTENKPYDVCVVAVLTLAAHLQLVRQVNSDGEPADWEEGVALARKATGLDLGCPDLDAE